MNNPGSDDAIWDEVEMSDEALEALVNANPAAMESTTALAQDGPLPVGPTSLFQQIELSAEQRAVLEFVKSGKSIFFTGSAGTGKSVLLRAIIDCFRDKYRNRNDTPEDEPDLRLAVTAATGIASVNIDGCTLHSWAGIGLGKEDARALARRILFIDEKVKRSENMAHTPPVDKKVTAADRWRAVETLVIDESMQFSSGLDLLADKRRAIGIVSMIDGLLNMLLDSFAQDHGVPAINRLVAYSNDIIIQFKKLSRRVIYDDGIEPTELFPTRREVEAANTARLSQLTGPSRRYAASDFAHSYVVLLDSDVMRRIESSLERLIAVKAITLKVGAQVMLIKVGGILVYAFTDPLMIRKNLVQGKLVNGTRGRVEEFISVGEAKDRSIDCAHSPPSPSADDRPSDEERVQLRRDSSNHHDGLWPLVRFETGAYLLCNRCNFDVKDTAGNIEAMREQVPLILAWALSIHKSQGQTLRRVRVNLSRAFEKGQALSRATSMETLEVVEFDPSK
ncbi:hypothetical protein EVJ58_g65 [Rhodofomes roseus]|uniref:ATP-dependent DNA helicase n=1 Tax=Rhodofomes roseus TaxID=34475 RepID=A0A4Y9Z8J0_9APHY|nr:hypothetical protein EVJ58_g65 [Rhodofomes roseus]